MSVFYRELLLNNNQLRVLPFELGKLSQLQTLGLKGEGGFPLLLDSLSVFICTEKEIKLPFHLMPSKGNPLTQEIINLYQEQDGTRRLLNYLLDNLAGAVKRSKCVYPFDYQ